LRDGEELTQACPCQPSVRNSRLLLVDLEPDVAASIPVLGSLACRHLCHVEQQRARVEEVGCNLECDAGAGGHRLGAGCALSGAEFVAANLG
jgi:hypothetical protein